MSDVPSSPPSESASPGTPDPAAVAPAPNSSGLLATLRQHPRTSIAVGSIVTLALVVGVSVSIASALRPPLVVSTLPEDAAVSEPVFTPEPEPAPAPTTSATIPISTGNTLLRNNDSYSAGPLSAVVWSPHAQGSVNDDLTALRFQTMLIESTAPVSAGSASWARSDGTTFGDFAFSAQLDAGSPAGFAAVATVTTPSSGLQAASSSYWLAVWSASSGSPSVPVEVTSPCSEACTVGQAWYSGDTVVVQWNKSGRITPLVTQGLDVATGAPLWSAPLFVKDAVGSTLVAEGPQYTLIGVGMSTGATLWTYTPPAGTHQVKYLGYLGGDYLHFHMIGQDMDEMVIAASTGRVVIARDGSPPNSCLCTYFSNMVYDASSDMVIVQANAPEGGGFYMEVVNASDGSNVFTLPPDQLAALGTPPLIAALDGSGWIKVGGRYDLFLETTGAQDPRASGIASTRLKPDWTIGSISMLSGALLVAHQGQALTVPLLVQVTAGR